MQKLKEKESLGGRVREEGWKNRKKDSQDSQKCKIEEDEPIA